MQLCSVPHVGQRNVVSHPPTPLKPGEYGLEAMTEEYLDWWFPLRLYRGHSLRQVLAKE